MTNPEVLWAEAQLLALDLESTDVDPRRDRIVTASIVTITPSPTGGKPQIETRNWLADPGVDIPDDATALHGITTDYARTHGRPAGEVVEEVSSHLARIWNAAVPLIAFNAPFDLTMLDAELRRHHGRGLDLSGPVVDPICIDRHLHPKRAEKRTLVNLCQHYKVRLDQAHTGADDAVAAARLAWRLAKAEPERIGRLTLGTLHNQQANWFREQQGARQRPPTPPRPVTSQRHRADRPTATADLRRSSRRQCLADTAGNHRHARPTSAAPQAWRTSSIARFLDS
ncbi:exonuclease domain-containing protein [Prauserella marina]|nr:exonuclease domain-containing protein [Prauserella marina]